MKEICLFNSKDNVLNFIDIYNQDLVVFLLLLIMAIKNRLRADFDSNTKIRETIKSVINI